MKRNILLFLALVVLSSVFAYFLGHPIDQYLHFNYGGFGDVGFPQQEVEFLDGLIFSYLFFTPFMFGIWGKGKRILSVLIISVPGFILPTLIGSSYLFWSLIFFASGVGLASIVNFFRN